MLDYYGTKQAGRKCKHGRAYPALLEWRRQSAAATALFLNTNGNQPSIAQNHSEVVASLIPHKSSDPFYVVRDADVLAATPGGSVNGRCRINPAFG